MSLFLIKRCAVQQVRCSLVVDLILKFRKMECRYWRSFPLLGFCVVTFKLTIVSSAFVIMETLWLAAVFLFRLIRLSVFRDVDWALSNLWLLQPTSPVVTFTDVTCQILTVPCVHAHIIWLHHLHMPAVGCKRVSFIYLTCFSPVSKYGHLQCG